MSTDTYTLRPQRSAYTFRDGITPDGRYLYASAKSPLDELAAGQHVRIVTTDGCTFTAVVEWVDDEDWPQLPATAELRMLDRGRYYPQPQP